MKSEPGLTTLAIVPVASMSSLQSWLVALRVYIIKLRSSTRFLCRAGVRKVLPGLSGRRKRDGREPAMGQRLFLVIYECYISLVLY